MGLAREIEKATRRHAHLARTALSKAEMAEREQALEKVLGRFFRRIQPKVLAAAQSQVSHG